MKRFLITICLIATMLSFSMTSYAKGVMYPHPEVETEITINEGEEKSQRGRTWKTVYGTALRSDMEHGELRYNVYLPESYDSKKDYPFLLFLHGGSIAYLHTDGTPWSKQLFEYADNIADNIENCIIFAPQAPGTLKEENYLGNAYWSGLPSSKVRTAGEDHSESSPYLRAVEKMMADFLETGISYGKNTYNIDSSRLYVTGHSMGGIGTYTILRDCPGMFAAAIISAGIGDPDSVDLWADTPVRILHGTKDATIPYKSTQIMAGALKEYPNVEIIPLEDKGHDIQPYTYQDLFGNLSWMAQQVRDEAVDMRVAVAIIVVIIASAVVAIWIIKRRKAKRHLGRE